MKRWLVILNPKSGTVVESGAEHLANRIHAALGALAQVEVQLRSGADMEGSIADAARGGFEAVVVGGGDGSIGAAARALAGRNVALGVLPLGTRNHFAKDLLGTGDFDEALALLARGETRRIDLGEVNGRLFVNNASIGLYAHAVAQRRAKRRKAGWSKHAATIFAGITTLFHRPLVRARIRMGEETIRRITPFVFVGNNAYALDLRREKLRPRLDGGELSVIAAKRAGTWCLLRLAFDAWRRKLEQSCELDLWRVPEVQVETGRRRIHSALDGELFRFEAPLRFRSRPGALLVIAPAKAADARTPRAA
jgi:diacylglycerol kinase family enzyme